MLNWILLSIVRMIDSLNFVPVILVIHIGAHSISIEGHEGRARVDLAINIIARSY